MVNNRYSTIFPVGEHKYDEVAKIWSGPNKPIKYGNDCSLGQILLEKLLQQDDHICLINCDTGEEYTSREVADMAINIARHFEKLGFKQGDIVGFCGNNTVYSGPIAIGTYLRGLVLHPVAPNVDVESIKHIYAITKPSVMLCDGKFYDNFKKAFEELDLNITIYTIIDHIPGVPELTEFLQGNGSKEHYEPEPLKLGYMQTANILCSSGTTGPQKAIIVTHATLMNCHAIEYSQENDRFLNYASLHWVSGIFAVQVPIMGKSTRLITSKPFNVDEFYDLVKVYKPTVVVVPPYYLTKISTSPKLKTDNLSSISLFFCGGSYLSPRIVEQIKAHSKAEVMNSYGFTESPLLRTALGVSNGDAIGKLTNNMEMKIIDEAGRSLGPNQKGELCVRGIFPYSGYYNNAKATEEACSSDGWIYTGDIGYLDDDFNLHVLDRKKDAISFKGTDYYPSDIENVILEMPQVAEVCVAPVPSHNPKMIPAIALIVAKQGHALSENEVYKFVSQKLTYFGQLEGGIHFNIPIPKTPSGKCIRRKLHDLIPY